jgi:hypothetical protein
MNLIICFYFKQGTYQKWRNENDFENEKCQEFMRNYNICNVCNVCKSCISCKKSVVSPFCWDQLSKEQINNIWRVDLVFTIFIIKIDIFIFGHLNIAIGGEYVRLGIENGQFKYRTFLKVNIVYFLKLLLTEKKITVSILILILTILFSQIKKCRERIVKFLW